MLNSWVPWRSEPNQDSTPDMRVIKRFERQEEPWKTEARRANEGCRGGCWKLPDLRCETELWGQELGGGATLSSILVGGVAKRAALTLGA